MSFVLVHLACNAVLKINHFKHCVRNTLHELIIGELFTVWLKIL